MAPFWQPCGELDLRMPLVLEPFIAKEEVKSRPVPGPMMPEIPPAWATRIVPWVMLNCGTPGFGVRVILRLVSLKLFEALPATNQETCVRLFSAHLPAKPTVSNSFLLDFPPKIWRNLVSQESQGLQQSMLKVSKTAIATTETRRFQKRWAVQAVRSLQVNSKMKVNPDVDAATSAKVFSKHTYKINK